jgi:hypothetical protein
MSYPSPKLEGWWVVHKVNPRERLHSPCIVGYQFEDDQVNVVYQEEELPTSFIVDEGVALNSLVRGHDDITITEKRKRQARKKRSTWQALGRRRLLDHDTDEY